MSELLKGLSPNQAAECCFESRWTMGRADLERSKQWITRCVLPLSSDMGMRIEVGWIGGEFGVEGQMHVLYRREWHSTSIRVDRFEATSQGRAKLRDRIADELRRIRDDEHG